MYDVIIIGGGAAGYGCALTLASVENTQAWAKEKKYMMIDAGNSDIEKARFYNLSGVDFGIAGDELLFKMQTQLLNYNSCELLNDTVTKLETIDGGYKITTTKKIFEAAIVVIATGMHKFEIVCDFVKVQEHQDVLKANKVCLENNNNKIADGLYVAGLASGAKTMFAIANGEGAKVACEIFKVWTGKSAVAHDNLKN